MNYIISTFINKQILIHLQRNRQSGKLKHETSHALRICMIMHFDCENSQQLLKLLITITDKPNSEIHCMILSLITRFGRRRNAMNTYHLLVVTHYFEHGQYRNHDI